MLLDDFQELRQLSRSPSSSSHSTMHSISPQMYHPTTSTLQASMPRHYGHQFQHPDLDYNRNVKLETYGLRSLQANPHNHHLHHQQNVPSLDDYSGSVTPDRFLSTPPTNPLNTHWGSHDDGYSRDILPDKSSWYNHTGLSTKSGSSDPGMGESHGWNGFVQQDYGDQADDVNDSAGGEYTQQPGYPTLIDLVSQRNNAFRPISWPTTTSSGINHFASSNGGNFATASSAPLTAAMGETCQNMGGLNVKRFRNYTTSVGAGCGAEVAERVGGVGASGFGGERQSVITCNQALAARCAASAKIEAQQQQVLQQQEQQSAAAQRSSCAESASAASAASAVAAAAAVCSAGAAHSLVKAEPTQRVTASTSTGKTRTKDKYRTVYSEPQKAELERFYVSNTYISAQRKAEISRAVHLSERQVKIWFQNRRAKDRKYKNKQPDRVVRHGVTCQGYEGQGRMTQAMTSAPLGSSFELRHSAIGVVASHAGYLPRQQIL